MPAAWHQPIEAPVMLASDELNLIFMSIMTIGVILTLWMIFVKLLSLYSSFQLSSFSNIVPCWRDSVKVFGHLDISLTRQR